MRVLCPIDFSTVSINACKWAIEFVKEYENAELHLAHFIFFKRRAGMFIHIDEIFKERAEKDFEQLIQELEKEAPNVNIKYSIYSANPKDGIASLAKKNKYNMVVVGTTGLTALKNMTIGSVTEYLIKNSRVPIVAIPENTRYKKLNKLVLAVDDELIDNLTTLSTVKELCIHTGATLHIIHVEEKGDSPFEYDPGIDMYLRNMDYVYEKLQMEESLTNTINKYCKENDIDMLCMVHHKRNWIQKILGKSITKKELFNLELPLLVLDQR